MQATLEGKNTRVVQDACAAFARGDVQTIVDLITDDIDWKPVYGTGSHVPMAGHRRGKTAVREAAAFLPRSNGQSLKGKSGSFADALQSARRRGATVSGEQCQLPFSL